jgi:hypothetical protein
MSISVDCDANGEVYCLNGGSCPQEQQEQEEESLAASNCACVDDYTGPHCEIGPVCNIECLNKGTCILGESDSPFLTVWPGDSPSGEMYCGCAKGYAGHHCEYSVDICGNNEHICLHGSKCVDGVSDGSDGSESYSCKCGNSDDVCRQQQGAQFCSPILDKGIDGLPPAVEYYGSMAVPAFCFNGGKCLDVLMDKQW